MKVKVKVNERGRDGKWSKARLYVSYPKESILENLRDRFSRPVDFYRKEVLPEVRKQLGLGDEVKFSWSQRAGCSCGCSPGFIISGALFGKDVWAEIEEVDAPRVEDTPEAKQIAANRGAQIAVDKTLPMPADERMRMAGVVFYQRMENTQPGHFKQWSVMVLDRGSEAVEVRRWGRMGTEPSSKEFKHGSLEEALAAARRKAEEKLRRGYVVVNG